MRSFASETKDAPPRCGIGTSEYHRQADSGTPIAALRWEFRKLKLPTAPYATPGFDRDNQIGSGSTDLLLGGFHRGLLTGDNAWQYFAQVMWRQPFLCAMTLITPPRRALLQAGFAATSLAVVSHAWAENEKQGEQAEEVTPPEDLMREHGVLDRVLLIYDAAIRQLSANEDFDPAVISDSAKLVQDFIENYHEKSEEDFLFPRFRDGHQLVDLVTTLLAQHRAGRNLTRDILASAPQVRSEAAAKRNCISAMQAFVTMYRPHAAREDTVLFPKLRDIVSGHEFDAIGDEMERREHEHFGEDGFEKAVAQVAELEKKVGLYDLKQFTPKT